MITLWLLLKRHISTQNEGKYFSATSIFQNGMLGAYLGHALACFRALKLLT